MFWENDVESILVDRDTIHRHAVEIARRITDDYAGKDLLMIGILKGASVFMGDLIKMVDLPIQIDFMAVSSYGGSTVSSGKINIIKDINTDVKGKNIVIVEDIVDTGLTLKMLTALMREREPASVEICAAFDKPSRRKVELDVKYKGIELPDKFVVGYGLDYDGLYRNLPDVCVLKPEVYNK